MSMLLTIGKEQKVLRGGLPLKTALGFLTEEGRTCSKNAAPYQRLRRRYVPCCRSCRIRNPQVLGCEQSDNASASLF
jgi:hypothetical protein